MALMTYDEACIKMKEPFTYFHLVTARKHLTLSPKFIGKLKSGITEELNAELNMYTERLGGVLIAYNNIKRVGEFGHVIDEQPYIHMDIQADFIVFKPEIGGQLKAVVNKIGKDHVGGLVHGCFNISIPKPKDTVNGCRESKLSIGSEFMLRVARIYTQNGVLSIRGNILNQSSELDENGGSNKVQKKKKKKKKRELMETESSIDQSGAYYSCKDDSFDASQSDSLLGNTSVHTPNLSAIKANTSKNGSNSLKRDHSEEISTHNASDSSYFSDTVNKKKKHKKEKRKDKKLKVIADRYSTDAEMKTGGDKTGNNGVSDQELDKRERHKKKKLKRKLNPESVSDYEPVSTESVSDYEPVVTIKGELGAGDAGIAKQELSKLKKKSKHKKEST